MRSALLVVVALTLGCRGRGGTAPQLAASRTPAVEQRPRESDAAMFVYGNVATRRGEVPARFAARLPSTAEELRVFEADRHDSPFPPQAHIVAGICRGDRAIFDRLEASLAAAAPSDVAELTDHWQRSLRSCQGERFCAASRPYLEGPPAAMRDALASGFAWTCAVARDAPLLMRADTPALAVLAFHHRVNPPFSPRIVDAIRALRPDERSLAFMNVRLLSLSREPRAVQGLWDLHRELATTELGPLLAHALAMSGGARGLEAARKTCATEQGRASVFCRDIEKVAASGPPTPAPEAVEHPETRALADRLRAAGLVGEVPAVKKRLGDPPADAAEIVLAAGRGVEESWTGGLTARHDELLAQLAALVPDLSGAVFEQERHDPLALDTTYTLRAYLAGTRYEVTARRPGRQDIPAVVGLLNAMLRARGSAWRLVVLARSGPVRAVDQDLFEGHPAAIIAGPRAELSKAVQDGLIQLRGTEGARALRPAGGRSRADNQR